MKKLHIKTLAQGINTNPALEGGWDFPFDLTNIEPDFTTGLISVRKGYTPHTSEPAYLSGDMVAKMHYLGIDGRNSYSRIFKYDKDKSYVVNGERIIIAGGNSRPKWSVISTSTPREYDLGIARPSDPPNYVVNQTGNPNLDDNILVTVRGQGDDPGLRTNVKDYLFALTYRFYNDRFGLVTPTAPALLFYIRIDRRGAERNIRAHVLRPSVSFEDAPPWSQGVEVFVTKSDIEGASGYDADAFNNRVSEDSLDTSRRWIETRYLTEELGISFHSLGKWTFASNSPNVVVPSAAPGPGIDLDLSFPVIDGENDHVGVNLNLDYTDGILTELPKGDPPEDLKAITLYAGRLWGYSRDSNSIVFSFIDGKGIPRLDIFPIEDTAIPHSLSLEGIQTSEVTAISQIPGSQGGLYVFFRDAIKMVLGKSILTGIFSSDVGPFTDLDASGQIPNFGTLSPNTIVNYKNTIIFLGSDRRIHQIVGNQINDIGMNIQAHLDAIPTTSLENCSACVYNDKFLLTTRERIFVFDAQYKYWTSWDIPVSSMFWSRGGDSNESILYGLDSVGTVIELDTGQIEGINSMWKSQLFTLDSIKTFSGIYVHTSPPFGEIHTLIEVDGETVLDDRWVPEYNNRFLRGFYARGSQIQVTLSFVGEPPSISGFEIEFSD